MSDDAVLIDIFGLDPHQAPRRFAFRAHSNVVSQGSLFFAAGAK
jgi:hypothetical protein